MLFSALFTLFNQQVDDHSKFGERESKVASEIEQKLFVSAAETWSALQLEVAPPAVLPLSKLSQRLLLLYLHTRLPPMMRKFGRHRMTMTEFESKRYQGEFLNVITQLLLEAQVACWPRYDSFDRGMFLLNMRVVERVNAGERGLDYIFIDDNNGVESLHRVFGPRGVTLEVIRSVLHDNSYILSQVRHRVRAVLATAK
jgi:hypothetical protein